MNGTNSSTQVVDLAQLFGIFVNSLSEAGIEISTSSKPVQQPSAGSRARRQPSRPAKPVSTAQHSKGAVWEIAFGVDANGRLSKAQQARAHQFFDEQGCALDGRKPVTMRSIVGAVRDVNASLRGENSSTIRYWAVFNGPSGRLSDHQVRLLLRSSK